MIQFTRKDLPLKSMITIYEYRLNEPKMDKEIIKQIDKMGDTQQQRTNVKAQMTDWVMWDKPGFKDLANIVLRMVPDITRDKYNRKEFRPEIKDMWGMKYRDKQIAIEHDHWPCAWSGVYYVKGPKDAPGLYFPEMGDQGGERQFEPGLLMFFPGHTRHAVRRKDFKGNRYVVAFNLYEHKGYELKTVLNS